MTPPFWHLDGDGWDLRTASIADGSSIIFFADITERKQAEEKIGASLAEKEVLLQEIHHRVKNNFQVIANMIMLQANAEKDRHARDVLMVGNNRIMAMARVHEKLYGSADLANIGARDYLESVVGSVMAGRGENRMLAF